MDEYKKAIHRIFDEVALEEELFAPGLSCCDERIEEYDIGILESLISQRAAELGLCDITLRRSVECRYAVADIEDLPSHHFNSALTYVLTFVGYH